MNIKKLEEFKDDDIFCIGTFIRIYDVKHPSANTVDEDFYDYMIADIPGESYKLITNVSRGVTKSKSGYSLGLVKTIENSNMISGMSLKKYIGVKNTYIIEY